MRKLCHKLYNAMKFASIFAFACVPASLAFSAAVWAEANVLGLPAIPQTPVVAPAPAASGAASGNKKAVNTPKSKSTVNIVTSDGSTATKEITDGEAKAVLNGGVTMASSYTDQGAILKITTQASYIGKAQTDAALRAARLVQRDLRLSCDKQCKLAKMEPAKILPNGKLQFDLAIDGLGRVLSQADMVNMVLGQPLAKVATPTPAPTPVPAISVTVSTVSAASPTAAAPKAASPASAVSAAQ